MMNYALHYDLLIDRARDRILDVYTERHHIIPVCIGGTNIRKNLVRLTPEEHYIAHLLLIKIYPEVDKLIFAAHRMCSGKSRNNKLYGWVRRIHADAMSRLHKDKKMSIESREKMSKAKKGKKHSEETIDNMRLAQQNRSPETRKRISDSHMGHIVTEETKEKLRQANLGKSHTDDTCAKMSKSRTGSGNNFYGKAHSAESREKMKEWHANRPPMSEETKKKISETFRKRRELKELSP